MWIVFILIVIIISVVFINTFELPFENNNFNIDDINIVLSVPNEENIYDNIHNIINNEECNFHTGVPNKGIKCICPDKPNCYPLQTSHENINSIKPEERFNYIYDWYK